MADPLKKPSEDRTRGKEMTPSNTDTARTGEDPSFVAVNTLPSNKRPSTTETTTSTERTGDRPLTEKVGEKLRDVKEDVKEKVEPGKTEAERTGMGLPPRTTAPTTKDVDWNRIENEGGCGPGGETDYGTRPVSELNKPTEVKDKADLAAARMLDREKMDREKMDREAIMSTATMEAAAMRTGIASKDMPMKEMPPKEMTRTEPAAGERTIRKGAAIGTEPTRPMPMERPMTGTVVPPGTERATPMKPYGTVDERSRMHAEDPSVHPDWETQPQINAPRDVGIPTTEGQADAARIREGRRRSDVAKEPRLDRRGGDIETPLASGARRTDTGTTPAERRMGTETKDDRSMTQKMRDEANKAKEATKEKAREVKEDVDRKI